MNLKLDKDRKCVVVFFCIFIWWVLKVFLIGVLSSTIVSWFFILTGEGGLFIINYGSQLTALFDRRAFKRAASLCVEVVW